MLECIPNVLDWGNIKRIRAILNEAEFVDGKRTAGARAKRVKKNEQLGSDVDGCKEIDSLVRDALLANREIQRLALPRKLMRPMFSRYRPGDNYGLHVDDALMGRAPRIRTDISVTVFISQADEYDGGELEIRSSFGTEAVKLPAGSAVIYPATTIHRVLPVSRGERLAAVTWIQSHVRSMEKREILADLDNVKIRLDELDPNGDETDLVHKTRSNLLRMWAEQ